MSPSFFKWMDDVVEDLLHKHDAMVEGEECERGDVAERAFAHRLIRDQKRPSPQPSPCGGGGNQVTVFMPTFSLRSRIRKNSVLLFGTTSQLMHFTFEAAYAEKGLFLSDTHTIEHFGYGADKKQDEAGTDERAAYETGPLMGEKSAGLKAMDQQECDEGEADDG